MARLLPFFEVGIDPRDGREFCLLTLSGARQFREVLDKAIEVITSGLAEQPEQPGDICKVDVECGKVHVVFMTDSTLDKIMGMAKGLAGLPDSFDPWKDKNGKPMNTEIPDWLMQLSRDLPQEPDPLD